MSYKTIFFSALLAGSMAQMWGMENGMQRTRHLDGLVQTHSAICGDKEFQDVMLSIAGFRKNLAKASSETVHKDAVQNAVHGLIAEFEEALVTHQANRNDNNAQ